MDRMLTVGEAAEALGTSVRFVRRLIAERRIGFNKVGKKYVRIPMSDVETFLAAGRVEPQSSGPRSGAA